LLDEISLLFFAVWYSRLNARDDIAVIGPKESRAVVEWRMSVSVYLISTRMYVYTRVVQDWTLNTTPFGDGGVCSEPSGNSEHITTY
jgi:hypothetical protein